jgi:hypothetical protein
MASLVRCVGQVPDDVPVGLHLCYGDAGHQHFKQPESVALQVRVLNEVSAAARRPVDFVSFTLPQGQHGAAYLAPLAELAAGPRPSSISRLRPVTAPAPGARHHGRAGCAYRRCPGSRRGRRTFLGRLH